MGERNGVKGNGLQKCRWQDVAVNSRKENIRIFLRASQSILHMGHPRLLETATPVTASDSQELNERIFDLSIKKSQAGGLGSSSQQIGIGPQGASTSGLNGVCKRKSADPFGGMSLAGIATRA